MQPEITFSDALRGFTEIRSMTLQQQIYAKELSKFFGGKLLSSITPDVITAYQVQRAGEGVTGSKINLELGVFITIMGRHDAWTETLADNYRSFEPRSTRSPATEERIAATLNAARYQKKGELTYLYLLAMLGTACTLNELRMLRLGDVDEPKKTLRIRAYCDVPERTVPMMGESVVAFRCLMMRAAELGCSQPEHFIFPMRHTGGKKAKYNPNQPIGYGAMIHEWYKIRQASPDLAFMQFDYIQGAAEKKYPVLLRPKTKTEETPAGYLSGLKPTEPDALATTIERLRARNVPAERILDIVISNMQTVPPLENDSAL